MGIATEQVRGASGLVVAVAEAEPVVGLHRTRMDPSAALGVPAHVTVLFPFLPRTQIDAAVLEELAILFARHPAFELRLDRTAWFEERVLWLGPHDPRPFVRLTEAVVAAYPACLPYEGRHPTITPHLTIGDGAPVEDMVQVERDLAAQLPIRARARSVVLLTQREPDGPWSASATFPLHG